MNEYYSDKEAQVNPESVDRFEKRLKPRPADPWVHRSEGMRCRSCVWYVPKVPTSPAMPQDYRGLGRCRRHAPTMNGYPVVWCDDWCGDHRLDENKI